MRVTGDIQNAFRKLERECSTFANPDGLHVIADEHVADSFAVLFANAEMRSLARMALADAEAES